MEKSGGAEKTAGKVSFARWIACVWLGKHQAGIEAGDKKCSRNNKGKFPAEIPVIFKNKEANQSYTQLEDAHTASVLLNRNYAFSVSPVNG